MNQRTIADICRAIEAGYRAEKTCMDDDMISMWEELSGRTQEIAPAGRVTLHLTPEQVLLLQSALNDAAAAQDNVVSDYELSEGARSAALRTMEAYDTLLNALPTPAVEDPAVAEFIKEKSALVESINNADTREEIGKIYEGMVGYRSDEESPDMDVEELRQDALDFVREECFAADITPALVGL